MSSIKSWTDEQLIEAVASSKTMAETLLKLNLRVVTTNYTRINKRITDLNITKDHFRQPNGSHRQRPLSEIMIENSPHYNTGDLKRRLLKEGLLKYECHECKLTDWRGKSISLELDHINGVNIDNRLENLRLLCPNCHAQTESYCYHNKIRKQPDKVCEYCGILYRGKFGQKCCSRSCSVQNKKKKLSVPRPEQRKVKDRPSKEEILALLETSNFCAVGRRFGVSDNCIRKWLGIKK